MIHHLLHIQSPYFHSGFQEGLEHVAAESFLTAPHWKQVEWIAKLCEAQLHASQY